MASIHTKTDSKGQVVKHYLHYRHPVTKIQKRVPFPAAGLAAAQKAKAIIEARIALHKAGAQPFDDPEPTITLDEAVDLFIKARSGYLSARTVEIYSGAFDHFMDFTGGSTPVATLSQADGEAWIRHLSKGYAPSNVDIHRRAIITLLKWLIADRQIERMPFHLAKTPGMDNSLPVFFTPPQIESVLHQLKSPGLLATIQFILATGLRREEVAGSRIRGEHLHLSDAKSHQERIYPLPMSQKIQGFHDAAIHATRRGPLRATTITKEFNVARIAAGITQPGKSVHALRHTFACRKLIESRDIYLVQQCLGHASVKTTERYLKFPPGYLAEVFSGTE
ncbi:MAG: tyrosine-type recombinase/integrase [Candidatus Marinimicrobia bacterium]|nr:tyrosine-type recombinase/integrase [Candidatus Neomarinimicrobiota bacterium]